jgi:hypothetical protein
MKIISRKMQPTTSRTGQFAKKNSVLTERAIFSFGIVPAEFRAYEHFQKKQKVGGCRGL